MSAPSDPAHPPTAPATSRRDLIIGIVCGLGVLVFVVYGIMTMGSRQQSATNNTLTGNIVAKKFTPQAEDQVSFGSKGTSAGHVAGEYVLQVKVKSESRVFDVPVNAMTYEAVRVGDSFSFMRPRSEQKR